MAQRPNANEADLEEDDRLTLFEWITPVDVVDEVAADEAEVMATLRYMTDFGHVRFEDDAPADLHCAA